MRLDVTGIGIPWVEYLMRRWGEAGVRSAIHSNVLKTDVSLIASACFHSRNKNIELIEVLHDAFGEKYFHPSLAENVCTTSLSEKEQLLWMQACFLEGCYQPLSVFRTYLGKKLKAASGLSEWLKKNQAWIESEFKLLGATQYQRTEIVVAHLDRQDASVFLRAHLVDGPIFTKSFYEFAIQQGWLKTVVLLDWMEKIKTLSHEVRPLADEKGAELVCLRHEFQKEAVANLKRRVL
jgi:hypothetical protein